LFKKRNFTLIYFFMMLFSPFQRLLFFVLLLLSLPACKTREKLVYLQQGQDQTTVQPDYQVRLRTDDQLNIMVGGSDMESLAPFQFFYSSNTQGGQGGMMQNPQMMGGAGLSYVIDINGNINFPVLGFVKLAGLTRLEAVEYLQKELQVYVQDVVVNVQLMNFKFTILGQVKAPGVQMVPIGTERLTILEAIGKAGDLQITGLRNNVLVVRELNGQRTEYRLNLTSKDLYTSPAYYIRQNDVIYVEPNFTANFQGTNFQTFTQLGTSAISIFLSLYTIISLTK
jgi:polysaccharide export outer membrane protein